MYIIYINILTLTSFEYVCTCVYETCMYTHYRPKHICTHFSHVYICIHVYACMCRCVRTERGREIYMYIYVYIYIYLHTYIETHTNAELGMMRSCTQRYRMHLCPCACVNTYLHATTLISYVFTCVSWLHKPLCQLFASTILLTLHYTQISFSKKTNYSHQTMIKSLCS